MARTAITAQKVAPSGKKFTTEAANSDGNMFTNTGHQVLYVENGSDSEVEVTLTTTIQVGGLDVDDQVIKIPAGETWVSGKLTPAIYNQTSGDDEGKVYVAYSAVTTVTVAVLEY